MKKIVLIIGAYFLINASNGFAAPISNLEQGQMSVGIVGGNVTNCYYFEKKASTDLTVGIQSIDNDIDFYGQIDISNLTLANNPKIIIGIRKLDSVSKTYLGAALTLPLTDSVNGYSSLIAGSGLKELQLGITQQIADTVALNLNYRIVKHNGTKDSFGLGLNCRI
ncbi:MAG TPA: hypothetical protein VGL27_14970 [Negativicutes bacterium]